jgi:microcystin-dependent protein
MAEPFLGQIEAFSFGFAPRGWALCAGQVLPIAQYTALFSLLGTYYGGDGVRTFGLPDLRGRLANAFGQGSGLKSYNLGQSGGQETHTLQLNEMAAGGHSHLIAAVNNAAAGGVSVPGPTVTLGSGRANEAGSPAVDIYSTAASTIAMASLAPTGGQPHENRMPFLGLNYCIALQGIFPSRN